MISGFLSPEEPLFMDFIPKYFKEYKKYGNISKNMIFTHLDFQIFVNLGEGGHRKIPRIRLMKFQKSWIWDQISIKRNEWLFANMVPISTQNIKWFVGEFWNVDAFGNICWGPKQSSFGRVFRKSRTLQWWNLGSFEILKHKNVGTPKHFKRKQILLNQTSFWKYGILLNAFEFYLGPNDRLPQVCSKKQIFAMAKSR